MRDIKFRAWVEKNELKEGHMIYWEEIKHNSNYNLFGGYFQIFNRMEFKPMQYTGLKDKNGKEIYEGDICFKKGYGKNCVIRWNKEWLKYEAFYGISDNGGDLTMGLGYWRKHLCQICDNCGNKTEKKEITEHIFGSTLKIIGNIYENPELLNK